MFGNNAFGALGVESNQQAGPSRKQIQGEEIDVDWLQLVKTNHDVNVRVSDRISLDGLPLESNLMVVSNRYGLLIVGSNTDVRIHRLKDVHRLLEESAKDASPVSEPAFTIPLSGRPAWIRLAAEETKLVVTTFSPATAQVYLISDLLAGNTTASVTVNNGFPEHVLDILPNPAPPSTSDALSRHTAIVTGEGLALLDIEEGRLTAPIQGQLTCASWSAKGKQIVCGERSGKLVQYTPDGTAKAEILPPPDLASGFYPVSVEWLENDLFLVSYKNANGDEDEPLSVFIIHRNKEEMTYTEFFDPLNTMGLPHRSASHRSIASLKQWGDQTRHLAFMLSGKSSEVGVMRGRVAAGKEAPVWESLILEETARGVMPTGKTGVSEDSSCMGLELDLTSTKPIKMGIVGGIEVPDLPPAPRLLAYSQEGFIISFDIRYTDAGAYPNMVTPQETPSSASTAEVSMDTSAPTASESVPPVKPAFGATQSTFGSTSSPSPSPSAFGSSTTPSIGFGQSAFGKPSTAPGFGQTAFGQPAAKSSSPSPFGQSTPSFGQTGFGQKTETKSAFGSASPSTSASPFGQAASTSAFGQSAGSTSAFGKPAFGGSATPAFGQTAFGAPSPSASPAFGASAFGTPSTPAKSPFGQTQTQAQGSTTPSATPPASAPAFGQTAFGQKPTTATTPAFGQTSTAQPTAFGQTAFGQPSKPTAFGQPAISTSSAFGSVPSTGGFAGFGAPKASGQTSSGFGASAFGQHKPQSTADSPFGSGGAVKTGSGSGSSSAFGSSSGFGQSAFGSGSGSKSAAPTNPFGKPADKVEPKKDSPLSGSTTPTAGTTGGFGLGGLGSALASSSSSIPSTKDGADSLFAPSAKIAQDPRITSPPDSPVLGATKAAGSEDDSPPPTPKSNPKPSAASSSNSFIKPATAFGTTFGQSTTPTSTPAKPISGSGTPNAFSQPVSTSTSTTPSASGFGSTGFGSSAFGKPATPGFGGSAFGKPHSTTPVGNITGGFGGFAAKSPSSSSGFSGFGATKSTSAFGSTGSGSGGSFASLLIGDKEKPKESLERSKSLSGEFTPPTLAKAEAEKVEVKEEPKEVEVEDSSEQPPTPVGYDVPSTTPAGAVKPTEEKGEEEDVKPDITSDELVSGTTPPSIDATEAHAPASAQTEPEEGDDNQDRAGSSPEIVDHADSEEPEHDDEQEHDNDDEGREEDVEDAEEYDEDGEEGEEYDEEVEGEGEYEEGEEDNYDDEEQYDENDREDYEDYEGEGEGEHEVEDEEREEGEAEVEAEQPQDPAEKASTPTDQTPGSLFSRLAPPSNPSFFGRHAARTSSPLGTQPPQNAEAESSTPPGTPPTKSAFRDASSSAPPPFFGFNKTQAGPELKVPTPVAFGSDNKTSLPSFGKSTSSEVGQASTTPAQSVQAKQPEKPLFSGFGLGRPSSPAQSPTPAPASQPFMFNKPQTPAVPSPAPSTPTAQPPAPSLFGQKPQPAPATPATPATPAVKPVADGKFAVPARTPVKESPQAQDDGSRQMAAVMQRMITDLISEIKTMKEALATHAEYHRGLEPKFNKVSLEDLDGHTELPFSSISDIASIIDQLSAEMSGMKQKDKNAELRVMELQSRMLKTDMKVKQVEKLVQAHDDATYAYHSRNQNLSPRQLNSRVQIRKRTQSVESKLEDLDRSVRKLKQSGLDGRPSIETLQNSLREVETAIADKQDLIEDLSMRVKSIRLSTPNSRRTSYIPPPRQSIAPRNKISTLDIPIEISDEVSRLIDREEKKVIIKTKVARLTRASPGSGSGAIKVGNLPSSSGKIDISSFIRQDEPEPAVKDEPEAEVSTPMVDSRSRSQSSTPPAPKVQDSTEIETKTTLPPAFNLNLNTNTAQSTSSPSPSFGGFTLSLNPGDLSSSHSRQRNTTGGSRTHHAAPRVNLVASPSPLGEGTAAPTGSTPAPVSFFPPPNGAGAGAASGSGDKGGPKGFFSLTGFGQK